jgi:hypothetical protein
MLLRVNVPLPGSFEPYWAGWDARNISTITNDGVCIHHPTGAPKRISSFTQTLTTGHPMTSSGLLSHYRVKWASTPNGFGVTEVGSSGAGLFVADNSAGPMLIGTLTGSSSGMSCSNNSGTSYFGKVSYHWSNNPNSQTQKLKNWLDPDDTGLLTLGGSADPCGTVASVEDGTFVPRINVFPNPANEMLLVSTATRSNLEYQVLDAMGRPIRSGSMEGGSTAIDVADLPSGLYHMRMYSATSVPVTKPFIIAH